MLLYEPRKLTKVQGLVATHQNFTNSFVAVVVAVEILAIFLSVLSIMGLEKEMSVTQKQGIIICIPKEDKPKPLLKNWRPVALLNTAYKIASACIANRLSTMLSNLIYRDQKGFMKGRCTGETIS